MPASTRYFPLIIGVISAALFVPLGLWQLNRLHQRRAQNAAAAEARNGPPLNLGESGIGNDTTLADRPVVVRGEYDRRHELIIRNHVYRDAPGIWVVTPLRIAGSDSAVLVNRGFVPSPDAVTADVDTLDEPGLVTVRGLALLIPTTAGGGEPIERNAQISWKRLDLPTVRKHLPYPVLPVSILQTPDSSLPKRPIRLLPVPLDDGPHLSYAVQWFSFAVIALVGGALLSRKAATGAIED